MNNTQSANREDRLLRQYEYEDRWVLAADLPVDDDSVEYDTIGDTLILVVDEDGQIDETELDLPGSDADVTVNNGVLTVQVQK
ncbi:Hsp20/alpha crystallin family protein [Halonotius terrestris]|uniref:Hsp20/alpha crystallin family protein n=1 Tax=Halonotius terrestris TaxID=2487750 RepID=A0A8J8PBK3_9EURY|nr:Hsp20/alpha crystallin family protein [Halonotius terrestris]TQQ79782.1 Hsp20/alpha crystallin family protein [Halonotius terrestris]